jgi:hypothetical protein
MKQEVKVPEPLLLDITRIMIRATIRTQIRAQNIELRIQNWIWTRKLKFPKRKTFFILAVAD